MSIKFDNSIVDEEYINKQLLKLEHGLLQPNSVLSYTSRALKDEDLSLYINNKIVQAIYSYNKSKRGV